MEDGNSIIYGLEHQTRALSPQYGEGEAIRFLIGTQSLKPNANQVHVVELEEDTGALHTKVYKHSIGEVWQLRGSPHDPALLATTHNAYDADTAQCYMGASIYRLPTLDVIPKDLDDLSAIQGRNPEDMELLRTFTPESSNEHVRDTRQEGSAPERVGQFGSATSSPPASRPPRTIALSKRVRWTTKREEEVRSCEWHGLDPSRVALVSETSVTLCDVTTGSRTETLRPAGRARDKYTAGKWNPHQGHTQLAILQDTHIKCVDTRSPPAAGGAAGGAGAGAGGAWSVEAAHAHLVRDIDFNPNRQFQLASVGDDGALRIWDYRSVKQALFTRTDHSHWVWTVRYNPYHEQLVLTGSSDGRALLTAAASVCAPPAPAPAPAPGPAPAPAPASAPGVSDNRHNTLEDGVLQSYEQHEDSVYCCEWSGAEPWTFASLSYDARLVISRVPRHFKYKILL